MIIPVLREAWKPDTPCPVRSKMPEGTWKPITIRTASRAPIPTLTLLTAVKSRTATICRRCQGRALHPVPSRQPRTSTARVPSTCKSTISRWLPEKVLPFRVSGGRRGWFTWKRSRFGCNKSQQFQHDRLHQQLHHKYGQRFDSRLLRDLLTYNGYSVDPIYTNVPRVRSSSPASHMGSV
jgi:hypothetical protein